jgi:hypothetical protein
LLRVYQSIMDYFGIQLKSIASKRTRERGEEEPNHKDCDQRKDTSDLFLEVQFFEEFTSPLRSP